MKRVLPRDAFNDANMLKCIGKLTMDIEDGVISGLTYEYDGEPFDIQQDDSSGSTFVANIEFQNSEGRIIFFRRPLNSREAWPLLMQVGWDGEEQEVFDGNGNFIAKLRGE